MNYQLYLDRFTLCEETNEICKMENLDRIGNKVSGKRSNEVFDQYIEISDDGYEEEQNRFFQQDNTCENPSSIFEDNANDKTYHGRASSLTPIPQKTALKQKTKSGKPELSDSENGDRPSTKLRFNKRMMNLEGTSNVIETKGKFDGDSTAIDENEMFSGSSTLIEKKKKSSDGNSIVIERKGCSAGNVTTTEEKKLLNENSVLSEKKRKRKFDGRSATTEEKEMYIGSSTLGEKRRKRKPNGNSTLTEKKEKSDGNSSLIEKKEKTHGNSTLTEGKEKPHSNSDRTEKKSRTKSNLSSGRSPWTKEEENILMEAVEAHGAKWSLVKEFMNGSRAPNCYKVHWEVMKKRCLNSGI
ncbi:3078_t:CDS:2 [Acaulospora morrowiae]|uniref:3078_t:CDS:1 n=1 Tax=Acaulospora morrowiae TaxID=94023 RepID=A0A9N8WFY3_9GLOM|nr:3078_t:CDS:2 [Acaulospora morrowiae]